jgi:hypothetical protein
MEVEGEELEDKEPESLKPLEWDFVLPNIGATQELVPGGADGTGVFSLRDLIGAMQQGVSPEKIQNYLSYYVHDKKAISKILRGCINGFPTMFYAVATNDERVIRACAAFGGDVNAVFEWGNVPVLAFAIINADNIQRETTLAVATLLSLGAKATVIPRAFYTPFCRDLPDSGPDEDELDDLGDEDKSWCTASARKRLAGTLNLTQRYYMEKSIATKKPSVRHRQVAIRRNAEALLGIHYFLIGQTSAATSLMQKLLSYMLLPSKRPLVLVFAG